MTSDESLRALATFARSLVLDIAVPVLSAGYGSLIRQLADDTALGGLARNQGIAAVLSSDFIAGWKKDNHELATSAEKDAERLMAHAVKQRFPDHSVLGEEHGYQPGNETRWVFDPIDGTSAMVRTAIAEAFGLGLQKPNPSFGITVGLVRDDRAILGIVTELCARDGALHVSGIWIGADGMPVTLDGQASTVPCASVSLADARLACTVPSIMFNTPEKWSGFQALEEATKTCLIDQNCVGFMGLLDGRTDIAYEADLAYHDVAALVPILQNAGLTVTDGNGSSMRFPESAIGHEFTILAALPELHALALQVIRKGVAAERNSFEVGSKRPDGHVQKFG